MSRTTNSSMEDGMVIGKKASIMFLGPEIKDRGVVAGVRSFVEGVRGKEWQGMDRYEIQLTIDVEGDLNSLSLMLQKSVLELVALIGMI
jgi:hypothetical protein